MELLNGLIHMISVDFESNNNHSTLPVDYNCDESKDDVQTNKEVESELAQAVIELLSMLREWKISIEFIESQCPLHDYKNIKANGYRTFFKLNTLAIKRVNKILSAKELTVKHLIKSLVMAKLMTKINNKIKEFHKRDLEYKQNLINNNEIDAESNNSTIQPFTSNNLFTSKLSLEFFEFYCELEQELADYFRYHPLFFFRNGLRRSVKSVLFIFSLGSNLPNSLVFSKKKKSKVIAKSLNNPTFTFPFSILDSMDCSFYNDVIIPVKYLGQKVSTSTIYLPRQYKFLLNDIETCMNKNEYILIDKNWSGYEQQKQMNSNKSSKKDKIRVRIIKNKVTPKNETVLFHVHGGAFVFHSPECHEVYSREFAKKLPEVVIMSVSYRTRNQYPKGQQDVLDAYLWLTSGSDEVKEVIGFQPKRIILVGDSAGAFLNFTLTHLLIDFNRKIQNDNLLDQTLRYPDALFNYYGFYSFTTTSPALFISCLDFFLPPTNIRIAFGSLLHGVEQSKLVKRIFFPYFVDKKKRWYDMANLKQETAYMIKYFESIPYLNSIRHFDYDEVKVPLYLVSSDTDLCLDHNIDLANRWKGNVEIQVLEDMIHGFLQLEQGDQTYKEDILKSIDFLRSAVDKL